MTEDQQPRVIAGRYTVVRELGRGGMGVVWLAEDSTIGRQVAIKELLLPQGIPPAERQVFEERVLREARTAGRLSDPGIVTVHDVVQADGATFIVMELVEAPDLADLVKRHGPMPPERVLKIADQMLAALEVAHRTGVVHRDVKPSNVIVTPNGRVKLTDFGIAQSTEDPRLTSTGTLMGSPTYISPERLLGHEASPASDLWALGATLFFASEGAGAFERSTTAASIQAIMNERAQLRVTQQGPLADLIMGLLNPDPHVRLTPDQARYLIDQARAQRPPTGPQPVVPGPMTPPGLVLPPSGPQPYPPRGGTQVLSSSPRKPQNVALLALGGLVLVVAVAVVLAVTGVFGTGKSNSAATAPSANDGTWPPISERSRSSASNHASASGRGMASTRTLTYGPGGDVTSEDFLQNVGTGCFLGTNAEQIKSVECSSPHNLEVFAQVSLGASDDPYPAEAELRQGTETSCKDKASDLSPPYMVSQGAMVPTKDVWEAGEHNGLCYVVTARDSMATEPVGGN
ncbi:serine/threonine-protein kinase [Actinocrispum wychmicini]|uniref:non-specific serine/threonine protein kinase n=1 Tax=Actinocrispum wychmicini TaxID=1213861 RepID=A0A4R2JRB0_9PSEU|nr:serine/threonine-protein kinase [Actinocrispum wychmicini]TCO56715.1 serine/threonine protein kinase [Actinocrispum wychmicini]